MQAELLPHPWPLWQKAGFRFFTVFVLLYLFTVPFPHPLLPDPAAFISKGFEPLAHFTGTQVFSITHPFTVELISDSTGLYLHLFNLAVMALLAAGAWSWFDRRRLSYEKLSYAFIALISYYLALQLFTYGFNKVFKWQFYTPEPNTLFTTLGETPRDLLYWSTMGTSRAYSIFTGGAEVLAGLLLLFRRTRLAGAIMAAVLLLNVVAINFCFDISVKIYSSFLLLLAVLIIAPDAKKLFRFFLRRQASASENWTPQWNTKRKKILYGSLKTIAIALLLADSLWLYVSSGNYNDDKAPRPALHGAYEVELTTIGGDTINPSAQPGKYWKRVFVHRHGYFITQSMNDEMQDYELSYLEKNNLQISHTETHANYPLHYTIVNDSILFLDANIGRQPMHMELKKIRLEKLPLLQNEFNWTIDNE